MDAGRADRVGAMFYENPLTIALKFLGVPDDGAETTAPVRRGAHTLDTWGRPTPAESRSRSLAQRGPDSVQTAPEILGTMMARPAAEGWIVRTTANGAEAPGHRHRSRTCAR